MVAPPRSRYDELYPIFRWRTYLGWAIVLSIALHAAGGPLLGNIHLSSTAAQEHITRVSVERLVTPRPTPPPTATPLITPSPHPTVTPHLSPSPIPPRPQKLKLEPPKTAHRATAANPKFVAVKTGVSDPRGDASSGAPGGARAGTAGGTAAAPAATPAATQKPSCESPNSEARTVTKAKPDYPASALMQGITGTAEIAVTLDATGQVQSLAVARTSGNRALDEAALSAARNSSYAPETRECEPVAGTYRFIANFTMQ